VPENNIPKIEDILIEDIEIVYPPDPAPWGMIILGVCAFLVLVAIVVLTVILLRRRKRIIAEATIPQRQTLARLSEAFGQWQKLGYMVFMFEVTWIIRLYIADRFAIGAPYRTVGEILEEVSVAGAMNDRARYGLQLLFERCDKIKFAAEPTIPDEVGKLYETAKDFVHNTAWRG